MIVSEIHRTQEKRSDLAFKKNSVTLPMRISYAKKNAGRLLRKYQSIAVDAFARMIKTYRRKLRRGPFHEI